MIIFIWRHNCKAFTKCALMVLFWSLFLVGSSKNSIKLHLQTRTWHLQKACSPPQLIRYWWFVTTHCISSRLTRVQCPCNLNPSVLLSSHVNWQTVGVATVKSATQLSQVWESDPFGRSVNFLFLNLCTGLVCASALPKFYILGLNLITIGKTGLWDLPQCSNDAAALQATNAPQ